MVTARAVSSLCVLLRFQGLHRELNLHREFIKPAQGIELNLHPA